MVAKKRNTNNSFLASILHGDQCMYEFRFYASLFNLPSDIPSDQRHDEGHGPRGSLRVSRRLRSGAAASSGCRRVPLASLATAPLRRLEKGQEMRQS